MNISRNSNNGLFLVTQIRCVLCEAGAEVLYTFRAVPAEVRVRSQVGQCEISGGHSGGGAIFLATYFPFFTPISCHNATNKE